MSGIGNNPGARQIPDPSKGSTMTSGPAGGMKNADVQKAIQPTDAEASKIKDSFQKLAAKDPNASASKIIDELNHEVDATKQQAVAKGDVNGAKAADEYKAKMNALLGSFAQHAVNDKENAIKTASGQGDATAIKAAEDKATASQVEKAFQDIKKSGRS